MTNKVHITGTVDSAPTPASLRVTTPRTRFDLRIKIAGENRDVVIPVRLQGNMAQKFSGLKYGTKLSVSGTIDGDKFLDGRNGRARFAIFVDATAIEVLELPAPAEPATCERAVP